MTETQFKYESEVELSVEGALNSGAKKIFFTQFKIDKGGGSSGPPRKGHYSKIYEKILQKCKKN